MRVEYPFTELSLGGLSIQGQAEVVESDAGMADGPYPVEGRSAHPGSRGSARDDDVLLSTYAMSSDTSRKKFSQTAIIVPTKNEPVNRMSDVFSAIPNGILIVLVSNSSRVQGDDKYKEEVDALRRFCRKAGNRPFLAIHQKDRGAGEAFEAAGETLLTDGDHKIRNGKGEGMLLGLALVKILCPERRFVGFVDSDNAVPGSVQEYCYAFAMGFHMHREEPNIMVRIKWGSKPKAVKSRLDYVPEGRSSTIVNKWFNGMFKLLSNGSLTGPKNPGLIVTGNAGEHAMTMDLASSMPLAGGYAIEPYHIMSLLFMAADDMWHTHRANGPTGQQASSNSYRHAHQSGRFSAKVVQIKTKNPHIHRPGDDEHIRGMFLEGLGAMFHRLPSFPNANSSRAGASGHIGADWEAQFRSEMLAFLEQEGLGRTIPPAPRVYKPLASLDLRKMHSVMTQSCRTLEGSGPYKLGTPRS